jgi:hypothetical protein
MESGEIPELSCNCEIPSELSQIHIHCFGQAFTKSVRTHFSLFFISEKQPVCVLLFFYKKENREAKNGKYDQT